VLGPHVWQHGAKKSTQQAHLDITHYKSLTPEQTLLIENEANRIVHRCKQIRKTYMAKDEAEKQYGFRLYQGGVVPGNQLRVVDIEGTDTEACCGTHCDNTAEVGTIKIIKTSRISDGILRLYYVAGENALLRLSEETSILNKLIYDWGVTQQEVIPTAKRFFDGYKKLSTRESKQNMKILELTMKSLLLDPLTKQIVVSSDHKDATLYISHIPHYGQKLKEAGKGVVFVGEDFLYGLLGQQQSVKEKLQNSIDAIIEEAKRKEAERKSRHDEVHAEKKISAAEEFVEKKFKKSTVVEKSMIPKSKTPNGQDVTGVTEFFAFSIPNTDPLITYFVNLGFVHVE